MRDKCSDLGIAFKLATLDEKICERLMEPAKSHEEAMITGLKDISCYLLTILLQMVKKSGNPKPWISY